jgi:hypothetical protein
MGKPAYNFGKTANLKAQQRKQMDKDLKRRIARQSQAKMKSGAPDKDPAAAEASRAADSAESTS